MSALRQDPATMLGWVREDLDKQLGHLGSKLEHLASVPGVRGEAILEAAASLDELHLTLLLLELPGAAMLMEEMAQLCQLLGEQRVDRAEKGFAALLDALVIIPAYLDRLQSGHRDLPVLLLPAINKLRSAHRASELDDASLFAPALEVEIPELRDTGQEEPASEPFEAFAMGLRRQFESAMLDWLNEQERDELLSPLLGVAETLLQSLQREDLRRTWWIAAEVLGAVADRRIRNDKALRRLLARLHLNIKALSEGGEASVDPDSAKSLSRAMLYRAALAKPGHPGMDLLRKRFNLVELLPVQEQLISARGTVSGLDRDMYQSMGAAIKDEFTLIKDVLDQEQRAGKVDQAPRQQGLEALLRLRDTLEMLGLRPMVQAIENLLPVFEYSADLEGEELETALAPIAAELLMIESSVQEQLESLGEPLPADDTHGFIDLPAHQFRKITTALLDEAIRSVLQFEDAVKSRLGGEREADLVTGLVETAGALELLGNREAAELVSRLEDVTQTVLREVYSESALPPQRLEWFTDAVAALEMLLAALRDRQDSHERLAAVLGDRLDSLEDSGRGVEQPEQAAPTEAPVAIPAEKAPAAEVERSSESEGAGKKEPVETKDARPEPVPIDPELLEVFLDEYDDVLDSLQAHLPDWLTKLDDVRHLTEVRRAFHTLKGSSRMVGAFELGDFSWQVEEMLNALLDARIRSFADAAVTVRLAQAALPALKQRLMGQSSGLNQAVIQAIGRHAESLGRGAPADWPVLREHLPGFLAGMLPTPSDEQVPDTAGQAWDDEVHAALCKELRESLTQVESLLEALSGNRQAVATEEHVRAAHTMAGTLALEPAEHDVELCRALEESLDMQRRTGAAFNNEGVWVLGTCLAYFQARLEQLEGARDASLPEDGARLIQQLEQLRVAFEKSGPAEAPAEVPVAAEAQAEEPAATETPSMEPPATAAEPGDEADDITRIFLEEAREVLGRFDSLLNTWRDNLSAMPLVQNLQREIHTFKGGARMVGLDALGDLSHAMEELLERTANRETQPTVSAVQLLEQCCDTLLDWVERADRGDVSPPGQDLQPFLDRIEAVAAEAAAAPPAPEIAEEPEEPKEFTDLPEVDARAAAPSEDATGQNMVRVDAEVLEGFIKAAGEVNIFRARLERQIGSLRGNLGEFNATIARLREQFRKLEIETEAQIHARYPDSMNADDTEFDPLELDRFSSMQQLSRGLSESVADLLNLEDLLEESARAADHLLNQQSRVSTELQESLMQTLMVPFGSIAPRLRRLVRKAAKETGKQARLKLLMAGGSDQLDRNVLEHITVPLEHMLRNAIAHGIEKPNARKKCGKDPEGEISIQVESEATEFVIRVEDDGAGINSEAIRQRAIERGLIDESSDPPPQQLFELILASGFSTSATVTGLAGRGVGMDVVSSEIKQIGGSLEIQSEEGKGSCFTIRIPFTLAIMQAIGVTAGEQRYLIPLTSVSGVARLQPEDYRALLESERPVYEFAEHSYPVLELEPLLGEPARPLGADSVSLLMIEKGDQRAALRVPELLGHREVVIKPVGPQITSVPGILGGSVTSDGRVVVIIDPGPIIRQALLHGIRPVLTERRPEQRKRRKVGMVVDDSITMRKVNSRVLEGQDIEAITAKDGQDAVEQMQDRVPDILLLDIEMPRMDGYRLAEYVRGDARLRDIPIIMITSRSGEKHRERAVRAGANAYLTKPYKEAELISTVHRLLGGEEETDE